MQSTITNMGPSRTTRLVWLGLGGFFSLLTLRVLLWEVHSFDGINAEHLLTIGAIVGAIASGVYVWQMLRAGKLLTAAGLAIAFIAATGYCLIGSAGRGDETTFEKNAEVRQRHDDRARAQRSLDEAKTRYETALEAETAECGSGSGRRCQARREQTERMRIEREAAEINLRSLPPEGRENGKLKRAAELVAFFGGRDLATVERGLALLWPFIPPLVCELLTIVFLHLGFASHGRDQVGVPVPAAGSSETVVELAPCNDVEPDTDPEPPGDRGHVVSWVREFQARNGRKPKIPELQAAFALPKTTAWRRIRAA